MLTFSCPLCKGKVKVDEKRLEVALDCPGCGSQIVSPDPGKGIPARALLGNEEKPNSFLPKAVLPSSKRVTDQRVSEGNLGAGRARRAGPLPSVDVKAGATDIGISPIPARPDAVLGGISLPTQRKVFGRERKETSAPLPPVAEAEAPISLSPAPAVEEKASPEPLEPSKIKSRGAERLNQARRDFTPRQVMEGELEVVENWGATEKLPSAGRKLVILGWGFLLCILLGTAMWAFKEFFRSKTKEELKAAENPAEETDLLANYRTAQKVLADYLASTTIEERVKLIRYGEKMAPKLRQHYNSNSFVPVALDTFEEPAEINIDGLEFINGYMTSGDGARRHVFLEVTKEDGLKIDWESLVGYSAMKWDRFVTDEPETSHEFRVFLQEDTYYNAPFQDKNRWVCFKIQRDDDVGKDYGFCFGYADTQTRGLIAKLGKELRTNLESGGSGRIPCRLNMQFLPESRKRPNLVQQVKITEFQPGWLQVTEPLAKE
jgi:hypothetical protein